jgi:glycosyltransferase involved in cell wall biosynthesis
MITVALFWPKYHGNVSSLNDLALGLDRERFKVIFIYLSEHGVDKRYLKETGCEFFCLSEKKRINSFRFSVLSNLVRILKEHHVDILHCHRHKATTYAVMAARIAGTPVLLAHVHGLGRSRNLRRRLINCILFRNVNRLVPVANSVKEDVLRNNWFVPDEKLFVLENSIDYGRFADVSISKKDAKQMLGMPADSLVFGTIGRLVPTKGLSYLIAAFSKVKRQMPSVHLVLVGDGPCRAELQMQAADALCGDSVHFLGHRANVEQLLKGMDVFILASVAEGMPRVLLEAMAAGVPCVATQVGGIPEVINGKAVGFLVPPGDPEALAEMMLRVAKMPGEELAEVIEKARDRIRRFYSHDVVKKKLEDLYEREFAAALESC